MKYQGASLARCSPGSGSSSSAAAEHCSDIDIANIAEYLDPN